MVETRSDTQGNYLIRAHICASFIGLVISALFGLLVSVKFHAPEFLSGHGWDTWGRLRYDHTQGILYAWMGNAFIAFLYYAVPFLTRRSFTSTRLGWWIFGLWNVGAILCGWTLMLAGFSQPLEWAELPLGVAAIIELCLLLLIVQFAIPFWKCGASELYVAGWYLLGGITFTTLAYPVGNILPHLVPGAMGAAFSGLWIHDAVGIFVTPFATAIAYFVIPAVTQRPIYSHFYSMIGFWLLFLVYPLNGIHHYVYSSLPMSAQRASEVASMYQGIDVIIVVTNLLLSIGLVVGGNILSDIPLRFIWTSVVIYLIVSLQGSIQSIMTFNRFIHFSDWVIGHSHLAMIGFASFAAMGAVSHIWQELPGVRSSRRALGWSYWLITIGLALMVLDLTGAGLVQSSLWEQHVPWIESVRASHPYWVFRSLDGCLLLTGFIVFGLSFLIGEPHPTGRPSAPLNPIPEPSKVRADYWISTAYGATFGAGLVFFVVSFLALGVYPDIELHAKIARSTPAHLNLALTEQEKHGQHVYAIDGCAYCHTQQVRFAPADERRFGQPTEAWETQNQYPQMWGTRRIGPDLARETGKRPDDWQLVHLYDPRYTVPDSIMPSYKWLFIGDPNHPTQEAVDLVAYLNVLGRAAQQAAPATPEVSAPAVPIARLSDLQAPGDLEQGKEVFLANCSGCHGADGSGHTPGGRALRPVAFNLAGFNIPQEVVWNALQHGVQGTAMPAWNELSGADFSSVGEYVLSLAHTPELRKGEPWAQPDALLEAGHRIFDTHCVRCHGATGAGDGPDASMNRTKPANFHQLKLSYTGAADVIHNGVPGSGMPAWPLLTPQEIQAVTYYLRSLYQGPAGDAAQPVAAKSSSMEDMR
jgi:cytochrome c oxidase cbb3-type subunit I/II